MCWWPMSIFMPVNIVSNEWALTSVNIYEFLTLLFLTLCKRDTMSLLQWTRMLKRFIWKVIFTRYKTVMYIFVYIIISFLEIIYSKLHHCSLFSDVNSGFSQANNCFLFPGIAQKLQKNVIFSEFSKAQFCITNTINYFVRLYTFDCFTAKYLTASVICTLCYATLFLIASLMLLLDALVCIMLFL